MQMNPKRDRSSGWTWDLWFVGECVSRARVLLHQWTCVTLMFFMVRARARLVFQLWHSNQYSDAEKFHTSHNPLALESKLKSNSPPFVCPYYVSSHVTTQQHPVRRPPWHRPPQPPQPPPCCRICRSCRATAAAALAARHHRRHHRRQRLSCPPRKVCVGVRACVVHVLRVVCAPYAVCMPHPICDTPLRQIYEARRTAHTWYTSIHTLQYQS